jgi:hypothetical protein
VAQRYSAIRGQRPSAVSPITSMAVIPGISRVQPASADCAYPIAAVKAFWLIWINSTSALS